MKAIELTERERVVLRLLADGATLASIAATEYVSLNTVKSQARSIYRKLGATSRAEAISTARQFGLLGSQ